MSLSYLEELEDEAEVDEADQRNTSVTTYYSAAE